MEDVADILGTFRRVRPGLPRHLSRADKIAPTPDSFTYLMEAAVNMDMEAVSVGLQAIKTSPSGLAFGHLTLAPILIACRKYSDLATAEKAWMLFHDKVSTNPSAVSLYHMMAILLDFGQHRLGLLRCVDLLADRSPTKARQIFQALHQTGIELPLPESALLLLKIFAAGREPAEFLLVWKSLQDYCHRVPGVLSQSDEHSLNLAYLRGCAELRLGTSSQILEFRHDILTATAGEFSQLTAALIANKYFPEAQQVIDWYLSQPAELVITLEPHRKHMAGLTALLKLHAHQSQPNLIQVETVLAAIGKVGEVTTGHYADVLEAYLALSDADPSKSKDTAKKGIEFFEKLRDTGVIASNRMNAYLISLQAKVGNLAVVSKLVESAVKEFQLDGRTWLAVLSAVWASPPPSELAKTHQALIDLAMEKITSVRTPFSRNEDLTEFVNLLYDHGFHKEIITLVTNQLQMAGNLVTKDTIHVAMLAALIRAELASSSGVQVNAYHLWLNRVFIKMVENADRMLESNGRLAAFDGEVPGQRPETLGKAKPRSFDEISHYYAHLLLPDSHGHGHECDHPIHGGGGSFTIDPEIAAKYAKLTTPHVPDKDTFAIRLKSCKSGKEAKRIYSILKNIAETNYPVDLTVDLSFCKQILSVCAKLGSLGGALNVYDDFVASNVAKPDSEVYQLLGEAALRCPEPSENEVSDLIQENLRRIHKEASETLGSGKIPPSLDKACRQCGAVK